MLGWVLVVKLPTLFPFFLFIPRCPGYSLVALVPSDFLIKVSFLFKLISLRLSKAGMHNIDVFMMWNILMSYILSLSDQMLFAPAIITLLCFFQVGENALQHLLKPYGCAFQSNRMKQN